MAAQSVLELKNNRAVDSCFGDGMPVCARATTYVASAQCELRSRLSSNVWLGGRSALLVSKGWPAAAVLSDSGRAAHKGPSRSCRSRL